MSEETYWQAQERERKEHDNWLRSLQPGQGAVISGGYGGDYALFTVERLTRTQIIGKDSFDREVRFRRADGIQVSQQYSPRLTKMTPDIRDAMDLRRLRLWLGDISYRNAKVKPTLAQLKAMKKAFDRVAHETAISDALKNGVVIQ